MKSVTITTKQTGLNQQNILNSLQILKDNKIKAVNASYDTKGSTFVELYCSKTKKKIQICSSRLFTRPEFINNMDAYLAEKEYIKFIIS